MEDDKPIEKNQVFFITSNHSSLDNAIKYSLANINGMIKLESILKKQQQYKQKDYTINVFSFEIVP